MAHAEPEIILKHFPKAHFGLEVACLIGANDVIALGGGKQNFLGVGLRFIRREAKACEMHMAAGQVEKRIVFNADGGAGVIALKFADHANIAGARWGFGKRRGDFARHIHLAEPQIGAHMGAQSVAEAPLGLHTG